MAQLLMMAIIIALSEGVVFWWYHDLHGNKRILCQPVFTHVRKKEASVQQRLKTPKLELDFLARSYSFNKWLLQPISYELQFQHNPYIWKTQFPVDTEYIPITKIQQNKYYNKKSVRCYGMQDESNKLSPWRWGRLQEIRES